MARPPRVRIISTGSEILQGLYPDTNAQNLSRLFFEQGFEVVGHSAVGDHRPRTRATLENALSDAELVVMTGGLGPTEDDVNRFVIAELYGLALVRDARAEEMLRERFRYRGITMPERNVVQADLPAGCRTLYNHWGTAPGFFLPPVQARPALLALPGPPKEWRPMIERAFEEEISDLFPGRPRRRVYSLHVSMTAESTLNEALSDLFREGQDTELALLANRGHIRIRLIATGEDDADLDRRISAMRAKVLDRIGEKLPYSEGQDATTLEEALLAAMQQRGLTLATAESCTGGWVAKALTDIAGSSATLVAGWVTYSNEAKARELGVDPGVIEEHGAVSEETARAMAEGARRKSGADIAISVTGIAGPSGGSEEKPVGTVWFALSDARGSEARRRVFPGDRDAVREFSMRQALELVRRRILSLDLDAPLHPSSL